MDEHYRQLVVYWRDAHARSPFPRVCCTVCPRQQAGVHARATLPPHSLVLVACVEPRGEKPRESKKNVLNPFEGKEVRTAQVEDDPMNQTIKMAPPSGLFRR